jgi:glucose-1-phosphate thymidylyltransferase
MLEKGRARRPKAADAQIVEPVYIEDGVRLGRSTVGPNVSVGADTVIEDSEVRDAIIGAKARIVRSVLRNSLIGDEAVVEGVRGEVTVADHSEVRAQS